MPEIQEGFLSWFEMTSVEITNGFYGVAESNCKPAAKNRKFPLSLIYLYASVAAKRSPGGFHAV
jgi:hypothetical protein